MASNPLSNYFRAPKLYTDLPSRGRFYQPNVLDVQASQQLAVYPMTARDEIIMKNPDALLNGEAVSQLIMSCVPQVKSPRSLVGNDVDALLVAIQGATMGDEIEISGQCPLCPETSNAITGVGSIQYLLDTMSFLEDQHTFTTEDGLIVSVKPFSYENSIKAGIANFRTTRSLESISQISDEMEQLRAFTQSFTQVANINFDLLVDSVEFIRGTDDQGQEFSVTDPKYIREYLENCNKSVGHEIQRMMDEVNNIGVNKSCQLSCETHGPFTVEVGFDPVNFFTGSSARRHRKK